VEEESDNDEKEICAAVTTGQKTADNTTETKQERQFSIQESMADLQSKDPDIGPILRLRLRQSDQPRPEEVISESEAAMGTLAWSRAQRRSTVCFNRLN